MVRCTRGVLAFVASLLAGCGPGDPVVGVTADLPAALAQNEGGRAAESSAAAPSASAPAEVAALMRRKLAGARYLRLDVIASQDDEVVRYRAWMGPDRLRLETYAADGSVAYACSSVRGRAREFAPSARIGKRLPAPQSNVIVEYDSPSGEVSYVTLVDGCLFGAGTMSWTLPNDRTASENFIAHVEQGTLIDRILFGTRDLGVFRNTVQLTAARPKDVAEIVHVVWVDLADGSPVRWDTTQRRKDGVAIERHRRFTGALFLADEPADWPWEITAENVKRPSAVAADFDEGRSPR